MNESTDPRQRAVAARLVREQRIQTLRLRVLAIAVALFLAVWVGLYAQLVSGHDPALAKAATPVATQSADPQVADDGWSSPDQAGSTDSSASSSSDATDAGAADADPGAATGSSASSGSTSAQSDSGAAAVTTRQS
jgi:cytoskeletal protein RodZ